MFHILHPPRYQWLVFMGLSLAALLSAGIVYAATHTDTQIWGIIENGSTSMLVRVCGTGPREQIRAENVGPGAYWISQIYNYSDPINNSCDPAPGYGGWRLVVGGQPGNQVRILTLVTDSHLPEAEFMRVARRDFCTVASLGNVSCSQIADYPLEVYNNANYANTWCYSANAGAANVAASCNDQISSLILQPGWSVRVYKEANQPVNGPSQCFTASDSDLSDNTYDDGTAINDTISSFVLYQQASCPVLSNPVLQVSPTSLGFNATLGGGNPAAQSFNISNSGTGTLNWTASDDAAWLSLSSTSGTAPATVNASVNISGLSAGPHNATITISSSGASGSPKTVGVTLNINSSGTTLNVRYVDQVYVQQSPECFLENGKWNCYWNDCGPASVAMALHYEGKETRDVLNDRQATLDLICDVKVRGDCRGASSSGKMLNTLTNKKGLQAYIDWSPTFSEIKQNIDNGHSPILSVWNNQHIIVGIGYKDTGAIVVNDPFGGYRWWSTGSPRNEPASTSPKLNGKSIEYSSINNLDMNSGYAYAIFITGPAPARLTATTTVGVAGGVITSEGIQIDFPPSSAGFLQPLSSPFTVTYTPQASPTHPLNGFEAVLTSLRLNAIDTNNQPVLTAKAPYTFKINVNLSIIENWDKTGGEIATDRTPGPLDSTVTGKVMPVLARWDDNLQQWTIIPSTFDTTNGQLIAQSDQFAEFAVLIQRQTNVYLPIIAK